MTYVCTCKLQVKILFIFCKHPGWPKAINPFDKND
jgi:hypothetical protein